MADGSRSSASQIVEHGSGRPWSQWAMPSVADLFFVAIFFSLVFTPFSIKLLGDAGIGWHIRTGQEILATHAVPKVDLFSSTMTGKPWFAWEWLYDVLVGVLDQSWGLNGPVWLTAIVIAATFAWLFRLIVSRGTDLFVAIVLVLSGISGSMIHFLARPHVFSWLFALAWFWILDSSERDCFRGAGNRGYRLTWTLPPLMLLWVNLHGGFVLGFALLAIFWGSALWTWIRSSDSRIEESLARIAAAKRAWHLTLVGLLAIAASLANPYVWKLHEHIWSYLSNRFLMDHIDEFQSPNFHGLAQRCFLVLLLIAVATVAARGKQLAASGVLTIVFAIYAGLFASRNIPVSSILLILVLAPLMPSVAVVQRFTGRMQRVDSELRGHVWPVMAMVFALVVAANGGRLGATVLMDAHFDPKRMPVAAVDFLEKQSSKGPVLSPDYWGGYLIYRLYPRSQVVVDDRHDLYGEAFLKHYLLLMHVERGWDAVLRKTDTGYVLLPRNAALANMLLETKGWKIIYEDEIAIAFVPDAQTR